MEMEGGTKRKRRHEEVFVHLFKPMREKNSPRVLDLDSKHPSTQLVTVDVAVCSTPRITMHKWLDSMTTATPCGFNISMIALATSFVRRS